MNRIAEDLKNTYFEMSKAQERVVVGADALVLELSEFLRKKRLTVMLRGKKRDGMKATETFDADISKLEMLKGRFCRLRECTDNFFNSMTNVQSFIDKKYFDDAALFVSDMLSCLNEFKEEGNESFRDLTEILYFSIETVGRLETEERFHLLMRDITEYMDKHEKALKILECLKDELDKVRVGGKV